MKLLHLVYIHGFQGNDKSFQSFPTDLQRYLSTHIPAHLELTVQSSLYPTYKSVKPISHATKNFLEWLSTQPPGPVILLGHSMGGLLAAEAAIHASNETGTTGKPTRIVGMVAFDTPYIGMHPHVVISGIASLFQGEEDKKSDTEMNDTTKVNIVNENVTDDWEGVKKTLDASPRPPPRTPFPIPSPPSSSRSFIDRTISFLSSHSNDPIVRWARKHADEPFSASKRWIIEHFQFGSCMFDPSGLRDRYVRLVAWQGMWVNYWTQTRPKAGGGEVADAEAVENDAALVRTGIITDGHAASSLEEDLRQASIKDDHEAPNNDKRKKKDKIKSGHHFIVLPNGLGQILGGSENWEKVVIAGVEDEVAAHCGLFLRGRNLEYDALVERVGRKVLGWCAAL
ncbi:putative prostaglandin-F synthase activity [Lyophyllum shimeji]|uniref:Prostaglandin-F synthase activity n=1 Tax=Lyophyllum shimeji TaxID=47721 RepID=A0A9P3UQ49_LYOSH|nr:putative prostaglandin-F synthase activity [Lyophyllum shimeji]